MRKIVRIIARLNIGGPAIHTILLTSELNKRGYHDVLVCGRTGNSEGDMQYLAEDKGVKPVVVDELGREISFYKDMKAFFRIFSIIRRERPTIVHTHTAKAGALGRLAALMAGVPVRIHTFHGHIFDGYFSPFKAKVFLYIERFLGNFTDKVIVVSEHVKEEIVNNLKVVRNDKCVVIPLGLELGNFLKNDSLKGNFRKKIGIGEDTLLVGIIGRLVPIKNHGMFLNVAKTIKAMQKDLKIRFIIVGDGELREELRAMAKRLGIDKDVLFTGWVKGLAEVYADLDVVALTSLNEGTPLSLIEAMASARPVIATDVGGVKDIVIDGENGFLAKNNDVEDFSNKLLNLLKDRENRSRLGAFGREFVRQRYHKDRLVNDIENLYRECMNEKSCSEN